MVKGLLCGILHIHVETCYENELLSKGTRVFCSCSSVEDKNTSYYIVKFMIMYEIYFDRLYNDHPNNNDTS